tara:strand:+ start:72922 stop:73161 length:240 start_codon:yes stop_codon:yes gene_type:complete
MTFSTSHIDIAVESISCFTDDGTLNQEEVRRLLSLALRDGVVDNEEKRVLNNIFNKVTQSEVSADTWAIMQEARVKHGI